MSIGFIFVSIFSFRKALDKCRMFKLLETTSARHRQYFTNSFQDDRFFISNNKKIMCSLPNTLHSKNYCVLTAVLVLDRWSETPCTLAGYVTLPNNKNRFFNPYRDHKSRRRAICNMFNAFIPFVQTSTTAKMIHVCIAEPALIDSIVLTAVVRLDLMALAAKMYQVRLTQLFNKYRGKTMEQLQRFHA